MVAIILTILTVIMAGGTIPTIGTAISIAIIDIVEETLFFPWSVAGQFLTKERVVRDFL